eukprot:2471846-Karenia_brevis.AAC.1
MKHSFPLIFYNYHMLAISRVTPDILRICDSLATCLCRTSRPGPVWKMGPLRGLSGCPCYSGLTKRHPSTLA